MRVPELVSSSFVTRLLYLGSPILAQQIPLINVDDSSPKPDSINWQDWIVITTNFQPNHFQTRPYVANGYFGQSLPAEGVGYWIDINDTSGDWAVNGIRLLIKSSSANRQGWPMDQPRATFGTITGFWGLVEKVHRPILDENVQRGWESIISGIPDWTGLEVTVDGHTYRPGVAQETVENYAQSWNFRNGIVNTNITWRPDATESGALSLSFTVLAHRERFNLGLVRLDIISNEDISVSITDLLDGAGATRSTLHNKGLDGDIMWTSVRPAGIGNLTTYVSSSVYIPSESTGTLSGTVDEKNSSSISRAWTLDLKADEPVQIIKYVGVASNEAFLDPKATTRQTVVDAMAETWEDLLEEHSAAWDLVWDGVDITTPGNKDLTRLSRSSLFHLFANTRPGFDTSLTVGGLSSDSYAGLVFWDADTWMYPPLLAFRPDHAHNIVGYRRHLLDQAERNSQLYNYSGALYPWTSARYGNCTGTGLCQHYQYHLNSDIALSAWQYYQQTANLDWLRNDGWPLIKGVADMFAAYVKWNEKKEVYETIRMGEPDEYVWNVNNGAFTNAGIRQLLGNWAPNAAAELGIPVPSNWSDIASKLFIPYDDELNLVLEYDGMEGDLEIKQASVALLNYPLGLRFSTQQAINDLIYYGAVTDSNGPAMTWSIFSISSAQLQSSGCAAYTYLVQSYEPYIRAPYYQFSEQVNDDLTQNGGISPAFPFLTGHGGFLQAMVQGLAGWRVHEDRLDLDPMLPPQIPEGVSVRGLRWRGAVFDVEIGLQETAITRRAGWNGAVRVRVGPVDSVRDEYLMLEGSRLVVPTRRPDLQPPTMEGNMVQCLPVTTNASYLTGHGPIAAVDGSSATLWRPLNETAEIILHSPSIDARGFYIDWAGTPPRRFTLSLQREDGFEQVYVDEDVEISEPYRGPDEAKQVKMPRGNSTSHSFDQPFWGVRSIKLIIDGTQGDKGLGATVAEMAIL